MTNVYGGCTRAAGVLALALTLLFAFTVSAQNVAGTTNASSAAESVPRLIRFSGTINGQATGVHGVTFAVYRQESGDAPLWFEIQNVTLSAQGHYSVLLGAMHSEGVPAELFAANEARWLGVQVEGQPEQPRVLLVSVPYAMKAADADTVGGLPPSAFLLAAPVNGGTGVNGTGVSSTGAKATGVKSAVAPSGTLGTGTSLAGYIPKFTNIFGTETDSLIYDAGTRIGINTTTPGSLLDLHATLPELRLFSTDATQSELLSFYDGSTLGGFLQYINANNSSTVLQKVFRIGGIPASSQFAILTGNVERVRVDAAGNVGIGTSVPAAKLDVIGTLHASGNVGIGTTTPAAKLDVIGSVHVGSGSVGIGTTTPGQKLSVVGMVESTSGGFKFPNGTIQTTAANTDADITAVTAGTGLTGGGTSGVVSLSLLTSCASGQLLKWSGTAWACANDIGTVGSGGGPVTFSGSNTTTIVSSTQTGPGIANPSVTNLPPSAIEGRATNTTGFTAGVIGITDATVGWGVIGIATTSTSNVSGGAPTGVRGLASATTGRTTGVSGEVQSPNGVAGEFHSNATSGTVLEASYGSSPSTEVLRVGSTGFQIGVLGQSGEIRGNTFVQGNWQVNGTLTKTAGSFKIDHPLDPENKYLYHSFVESPDMMNIYNGNVTLDARGRAWVTLPDWFEALNQDFRYQLTSLGRFAPVYIAREINGNRFLIAGGRPHGKVSWQVTGIRHDAYANAHRIPVEEAKPATERGTYLYPDLFARPESQSAGAAGPTGSGLRR
jgi:hypothetical protein